MKIESIKPIPKYIYQQIVRMDHKLRHERDNVRFYSYFTKNAGELVLVTVAVKKKKDALYTKQVAVHGLHAEKCFVRDMEYHYMGGYMVGFCDMGLSKTKRWFEDGKWYDAPRKYYMPFSHCINPTYPKEKYAAFRYSMCDTFSDCDIIKYLRIYEKYPEAEYVIKMGLVHYALKKMILQKCRKSKPFRKWLFAHREELSRCHYDVQVILEAFSKGKSLEEVQSFREIIKRISHSGLPQRIKEQFPEEERQKLYLYISSQKTSLASYNDYLHACMELGLDIHEEKHRYPHDFKRWHDIRTDEYRSQKAAIDERKRAEMADAFLQVAEKYASLETSTRCNYLVLIARSPQELVQEGKALHHCVGSMGYDMKMLRESSLIFFVREREAPDKPFVTVEYSLANQSILQCYGDHNHRPCEAVLTYLKQRWLPRTKRQLKKLTA